MQVGPTNLYELAIIKSKHQRHFVFQIKIEKKRNIQTQLRMTDYTLIKCNKISSLKFKFGHF